MIDVDYTTKYSCNFQDGKKSEPTLKLLKMNKGIYVVNFVPALSALQAFAIAVAFIHSHTPDLCPKL